MPTFLDEVEIEVESGRGGNGSVSFRREAFVPHGGPNGGNGGRGGSVVLVADHDTTTLLDYRYQTRYKAAAGGDGAGGDKDGKNGEDLRLKVPVGTVVFDAEPGERICDLTRDGQEFTVARGGTGGFGNTRYKSSARQAPRFAQQGAPNQKRRLRLELKLLADVGIIGYPNAGKSTLISQVSAARPKIADYPFTTLEPNLGVVRAGDSTFVMADMPGLIEGAHTGVGLGDRFLRHIERTRVLVHLIDVSPTQALDPVTAFDNINRELQLYGADLTTKPMLVGLNKIDTLGDRSVLEPIRASLEQRGFEVFELSAATGEGASALVYRLAALLTDMPVEPEPSEILRASEPHHRQATKWAVTRVDGDRFRVTGPGVERMVAMTDMNNDEALRYLHYRLVKLGVIDALRTAGCDETKTVEIGEAEFDFVEEM